MSDALQMLKALADSVRMRIVRAVLQAELSVAELVSVLGLPQSTVSRHLKPLREVQLVETRRDGTSIYYRRGPAFDDAVLAQFVETQLAKLPSQAEDRASVRRVLEGRKQKSRDFFDRIAGRYGSLTEPGGGWLPLAAGLAAGFRGRTVADLGAGEGDLSLLLAPYAKQVMAVDASLEMVRLLQARAEDQDLADRISAIEGDIESLPIADGVVDSAFLSQALHHASSPKQAIKEAARIVRSGGSVIILDLAKHEQEWVKQEWADQWMGFDAAEIRGWLEQADLTPIHEQRITGSTPELSVLAIVATKP